MTFRTGRPMLLTLGTLAILASPAWAQSVEPSAFPPPPPVPPFVPPPEPLVVAPLEPTPTPDPPPSLPPLVLPPVSPRVPSSIQSNPRVLVPVEPGELKPARPVLAPADSVPFWASPGDPIGPDIHRSILNDFELLPFGLAVQAPSFIDQAAPTDVFRARADAFYNMLRPSRAEYFWSKQSFLRDATQATDAFGPPLRDWKVNAQIVSFYGEARLAPDVSIFTNVPFRFTDPEFNVNHSGIGDVSLGFKWAFVLEPNRAISAQVTGTAPAGWNVRGLGAGNWTVEPALLWQESFIDRLTVFAEVKDLIPIHQRTNFAGNILQYGLGGSFVAVEIEHVKVMPTVEGVGWTIFSGAESPEFQAVNEPLVQDSRGKTIVNVNAGIRFSFGDSFTDRGYLAMSDLYIGYGHAVTGTRWYRDIYRIEYRLRF